MSNSYRIRTKVGVDTSLKVMIDQEFEYLEILSLKILQSDIYTRQCADYGVVVGRVSVNNGFGIPNAKVSIFIPLDAVDKEDPVTSNIYPYTNLYDVNDDGYRYNLLPYKPSYSAHVPTGTFFTRRDVLLSPVLGDIYDKYYKYNAVTNQSGDYMIFGVPVGSHTIVVDVDLSDIGEFSLSPQDLIRMGVATENQVDGTKFRSSSNLGELPQIVSFKRTIEIEPLWGQPEICNLGITRTDFDLTGEANIDIRPTAIFMGSIISDSDSNAIRKNCNPTRDSGFLCNLIAGPGEILAIRQTIFHDADGRPILESYGLDGGGTIIDTQGTWLVDVPMNLDYYITNEFGEQVLSPDPHKGIPTKGKYRFKVKWAQSPSGSAETKRAYFLVPNIKQWGDVQKSYAFSLNWDDYWDLSTDEMLQEAIDCKDKFYLMQYNKVYTVSQFIGESRSGGYQQFTGIKNILDEACESENNRYPTNDGYFRFDFFYVLFSFLSIILTPVFFALILLLHLLYFVIWILRVAYIPYLIIYYTIFSVDAFIGAFSVGFGVTFSAGLFAMGFVYLLVVALLVYILIQLWKMNLAGIQVPILTYPDCSMCACNQGQGVDENPDEDNGLKDVETGNEDIVPCSYITSDGTSSSALTLGKPVAIVSSMGGFKVPKTGYTTTNFVYLTGPKGPYNLKDSGTRSMIATQFTGKQFDGQTANPGYGVPSPYLVNNGTAASVWTTTALPIADRINLFNVKAKYFDSSINNPGGGVNRITVKYDPIRNTGANQIHYDNTVVILCDKSSLKKYVSGQMIAFQNPSYSKDPNLNSPIINKAGNYAITGVTFTGLTTVNVPYANYDGSGTNNGPTYNVFLTGNTKYNYLYRFPTDVEYFQVITGMTYDSFIAQCSNQLGYTSLNNRYISNKTTFWRQVWSGDYVGAADPNPMVLKAVDSIKNHNLMGVVILNRGVDPYTDKIEIEYGLGKLFGYSSESSMTIKTKCRMNIPIQGKFLNTSHLSTDYNLVTVNGVAAGDSNDVDHYSGNKLFYDSFAFTPQNRDISGNTIQYQADMSTAYTMTFISAGYSGFNSDLISYYSKLDNRSGSFSLQCNNEGETNPSILSGGKVVANIGFSVKGGNNWFTRIPRTQHSNSIGDYLVIDSTNLYNINFNNEGYIPNEVVEGSAIMNLRGSIGVPWIHCYCCHYCSTWWASDCCDWQPPANPVDTLKPYYWSPTYDSTGNTLNFSSSTISGKVKIMRGDRLPTSTVAQEFCCNSWVLQKNANLQVYLIPEKGVIGITSTAGSFGVVGGGNSVSLSQNQKHINGLFNTFTCKGSVNLECYDCARQTINGAINGTVKINYDNQYSAGKRIFNKGCYIFITRMFLSLVRDWELMAEWISRNMVMLGACRNVFSHTFNNNWVNGNLYALSFKNDIVGYSSPTSNPPNAPINQYCSRPNSPIIYHIATKSFYYRCTPFDGDDFTGTDINYPTTMMDLGPRSSFLQEIIMSDEYDGYIANKLNSSSFSHVDEILNLFIISRFLDNGFIQNLLAGANILAYFQQDGDSRGNMKIDGDYAQLISINSELGVAAFQASNYPDDNDPNKQSPIFFDCQYLGIFYSSDTQTRDFVTPKRTIIDPTALVTNQSCAFSNFPVYSQVVPLSQWEVKGTSSIFGNEENNWNYDTIYTSKYQSLDRLNSNSRYFRNDGISVIDDKGYIYAVNSAGDLSAGVSNWEHNNPDPQMVTVGAPFHFYFGLKRGKSAYDRFRSKWVNTEITTT